MQEVDEFFEQEKTFLLDYSVKIKDSAAKAEKMTRSHKSETISSKQIIWLQTVWLFVYAKRYSYLQKDCLSFFLDVADDYNHISGALNSTAADNNPAFKK